MHHTKLLIACTLALTMVGAATPALAQMQDLPRWGRVSFFAQSSSNNPTDGGLPSTFTELSTSVSAEGARHVNGGFEYGLNVRFATYPSTPGRGRRTSVYDAYVAGGLLGGRLFMKAGQMWLTDMGGLGAVAGGLMEYRQQPAAGKLRFRLGAFGGLEPQPLDLGYASGITKFGGYVAVDGGGAEKHVVGYVTVRNQGVTEHSVLTITNFIPAGRRFFLYQAAEVTLGGAGGQGKTALGYFFVNVNASPASRLTLQLTYHRGQSIDFRSITDDIINGRAVPAKSLDGFLFASVGGRATVEVIRGVRVFAGYSQDKNGNSSDAVNRVSFGMSSSNLLKTGIDLYASDYRYSGGSGPSYNSWYVSLGRSITSRIYISGEYTSSLSVVRYMQSSGVAIENRPSTKRFGGSGIVHLGRKASLLFTFDRTQDTRYNENRFLGGLTYRF